MRSAAWAGLIARHLTAHEAVPAARLTAVGRASAPDSKDPVKEPTVTLVIRPADPSQPAPSDYPPALRRRPTEYQHVIQ